MFKCINKNCSQNKLLATYWNIAYAIKILILMNNLLRDTSKLQELMVFVKLFAY